jgi:imidazolonepropionase-like amidohydrolase
MKVLFRFFTLLALVSGVALAQDKPQAYIGAQIIPINGQPIANGVLVVHQGKIIAVGASGSTQIPADAERHNLSGKVIMPGLVDSHSHIGGGSGGDGSAPLQPDVRVMDSINARDTGFQRAQAGGITTANVMPGSGHLLSGQTLYLKYRDGKTLDDLVLKDAQGNLLGGMKMANGTNSIRTPGGPFPGSRSKSAALARELFIKAQNYRERVRQANGEKDKMPPRDLAMEGLLEVLEGRRVVHFHTHKAEDILTALRLAKEFGFKIVLQHVSEAWKVAGEIAKSGAPSSIIMIDSPGGKLETVDVSYTNGVSLERVSALVGFHTDDNITDSRFFLRSAGLAVRAGMSREKALYGLTMAGAIMLDLQNRIGSLERGKDADFIILSGDPLSVYTRVLETHIDGIKVFDFNNPKDRLYALGGYGATSDQQSHLHDDEDNL